MNAKEFNDASTRGTTAAGRRVPALRRKYEAVLRSNAKKTRAAYETVTGATPPEDPSNLLDENALKVSITARTAAERKRIAAAVATPIVGKQKPAFFEATLRTIETAQAEAATKAVRDALTQVIADSLAEGWTIPDTAEKIETTLTDYASWEAERLARTDLVGISNAISAESARTLGDTAPPFKRWLSAGDTKVRETHREANGQTVEIGKTFNVGGFPMDHPGDFLAPYAETMNCRCTQVYLDTESASLAHSFEGGIVDAVAEAVAAAGMEEPMENELAAAAVDFSSGTMIALYPEGPDRLAVPGGQDESDLHVTLCFLPNGVDGDRETLIELLSSIAALTTVLEGEVGGMGFFAPGPDGMPAIALPDVVGLNELRTAVAAAVEASGTTYATSHGFLPHITILYVPEDQNQIADYSETPDLLGVPLVFSRLTLKEGDLRFDFEFASAPADTLDEMDPLVAAAFPAQVRRKLAAEGEAMSDGSFPIRNRSDLANAISSLGRAKDAAAAKRHIVKRAQALGAEKALPESWGITAASVDLAHAIAEADLVDPWYLTAAVVPSAGVTPDEEEIEAVDFLQGEGLPESAPVAGIIYEQEARFRGNERPNLRLGTGGAIPTDYDSVRAAREAGLGGMTAAGAPLAPPDEWFDDPGLEAPTPLTVTADGRVYGHLGEWGKCHTGIGGRCVMIPHSRNGYADFHNGGLVLASGDEIRVGKITLDTGHAPLQAGASRASAHYDHTGHVGAFVRAGEDQFGPWLAGAVRSDATPEMIRDLRANPPSGDWRKLAGRMGLELIAALAVPVQGFPVAALSASGEITAFISGWDDTEDLALVASAEVEDLEREFRLLEARLGGMDGLAALVAANPRHDQVGRFDFGMRAREAKAMRNTNELDNPPVYRGEVGRQDAPSTYGSPAHAIGDRVRTGEGHLGEVVGHTHSGSMVQVRREMDGAVESHDPSTVTKLGTRAAKLPPREKAMVAAGVRITIEVDGDEMPVVVADASLDREIGLRVDYFRDHGYWPENPLAGGTLTDAEFGTAISASALMVEHPDSPSSVELRGRLVEKGLLV